MFKSIYNSFIWFWVLFTLLFFVYAYQEILTFPAHSIHSWRQSDCLSLAQNFMGTNNPLEPSIHNYISDNETSGKSAGEFTGLYYLVGKIWNITGVNLGVYRAINIILMAIACFALFNSLRKKWKDTFWSLFLSLFLFTSPLIVFYTPNFLTDITALAFTIMGWAYFIRYLGNKHFNLLIFSFGLFALAALFKITAAISFLSLLGIFGLELIGAFRKTPPVFKYQMKTFILFIGVILIILSWYFYAEYYNQLHGGKYTFNNLWPLWALTPDHYKKAIAFFNDITFWQFFHRGIFWMIALLTLSAFIITFKNQKKVFVFLLFIFFGSTCYVIFWFGALENHDYYFLNLFIIPLIVLGINIHFLIQSQLGSKIKTSLKGVGLIVFILGVFYSASNIRLRYSEKITVGKTLSTLFFKQSQIDYWRYTASNYRDGGLFTMEKYNRSIGIKKDDLIICYPDFSFNIALFRLNQKGWSSFDNPDYDPNIVEKHIHQGAKYLIINKIENPNTETLDPFMKDSVGFHKGYTVYKLPDVHLLKSITKDPN